MKRNLIFLLSLIVLFVFTACQPQQNMTGTSSQTDQTDISLSKSETTVMTSLPAYEADTVTLAESKPEKTMAGKTISSAEDENKTQMLTETENLTSVADEITSAAIEKTSVADNNITEQVSVYEIIEASEINLDQSFSAYKRLSFFYGEFMDCYIEVYTQAEVDENGEVWWDDSNAIAAIAVMGGSSFLIFPEEYVQLGEPKFSVFESEDSVLHILLEDKRSAQFTVYDFVYNTEKNQFEKSVVVDFPGCNFWGTI